MRLFDVTFDVSIPIECLSYPARVVLLAEDANEAKEKAQTWFRRKQPYHTSDDDRRIASVRNIEARELESFLLYCIETEPRVMELPAGKKTRQFI